MTQRTRRGYPRPARLQQTFGDAGASTRTQDMWVLTQGTSTTPQHPIAPQIRRTNHEDGASIRALDCTVSAATLFRQPNAFPSTFSCIHLQVWGGRVVSSLIDCVVRASCLILVVFFCSHSWYTPRPPPPPTTTPVPSPNMDLALPIGDQVQLFVANTQAHAASDMQMWMAGLALFVVGQYLSVYG